MLPGDVPTVRGLGSTPGHPNDRNPGSDRMPVPCDISSANLVAPTWWETSYWQREVAGTLDVSRSPRGTRDSVHLPRAPPKRMVRHSSSCRSPGLSRLVEFSFWARPDEGRSSVPGTENKREPRVLPLVPVESPEEPEWREQGGRV
jgi:hypothetical protein